MWVMPHRRRSLWLAVAMSAITGAHSLCPKAVSLYAMQKTGSTFLGLFSRSVALRQHMCKVYQNTKEFVCETVSYIDCPRNALHRKSVHLERAFSPPPQHQGSLGISVRRTWDCGEPELVGPKGRAQWRCKPDAGVQPGGGELRRRCNNELRHEMFAAANGWLRSTATTARYRYNYSLSELLSSSGFVRGPMRQLYTEADARAVPWFGGYHNVVIVHTRCARCHRTCPIHTTLDEPTAARLSLQMPRSQPPRGDDGVRVLLHCRPQGLPGARQVPRRPRARERFAQLARRVCDPRGAKHAASGLRVQWRC